MPDIITSHEMSETVHRALREAYAIDGSLVRLPGENLNFLVQGDDGRKFIAKIAGHETPSEVVEMEFAALGYLSRMQTKLQFPEIVINKHGKLETGINFHNSSDKRLRLLNYVRGENMSDLPDISDMLQRNLGESLAGFDLAMVGFDHPAAHRSHRWDLARAAQHRASVAAVPDPERRDVLYWAFNQLVNSFSRFSGRLRWQFIHGDANPENIRVDDGRIVGLLDFGDSCHNPIVCDLAICLAYQMMDQDYPFEVAERVIRSFESVRPLLAEEREVLLPLVCARLSVTICVATERRKVDPDNSNWFVSEAPAWRLLMQLYSLGRKSFYSS